MGTLSKKPNKQDDWSCVEQVTVVYPHPAPRPPSKYWYHGRLRSSKDMCIVEDVLGYIHVVNKSIVFHELQVECGCGASFPKGKHCRNCGADEQHVEECKL